MLIKIQIKHFYTIWQSKNNLSSKYVENLGIKTELHIRFYGSCGTDLGRSIAEVTDNIHAIGVVKPVYERSTYPITATAVLSKGHIFKKKM